MKGWFLLFEELLQEPHPENTKRADFSALLLIRYISHNVPHIAFQNSAECIDGVGADALIPFQPGNLPRTDIVFFDQGILGDALFLHHKPQVIVRNQGYHPPLLLDMITESGI